MCIGFLATGYICHKNPTWISVHFLDSISFLLSLPPAFPLHTPWFSFNIQVGTDCKASSWENRQRGEELLEFMHKEKTDCSRAGSQDP